MDETKVKETVDFIREGIDLFSKGILSTDEEITTRVVLPMSKIQQLTPELIDQLEKAKDDQGRMIIHRLCETKTNLNFLKMLLTKGANVNTPDSRGLTPAHYVAKSSFGPELLKILAPYKPNLNPVEENGYTPVHLCAIYGQPENLKSLLEMGADPKIKDEEGQDLATLITELNKSGDYSSLAKVLNNFLNQEKSAH